MIKVVWDQQYAPMFCKWIQERLPDSSFDPKDTITFANVDFADEKNPKTIFAIAYHNRTKHTVQISAVSNGEKRQKLTPDFLRAIWHYAFVTDKRLAIYASVNQNNALSIALCEKMGFKRVGTLPHCEGENQDSYLFAFTKEDWLKGRYGDLSVNKRTTQDTVH